MISEEPKEHELPQPRNPPEQDFSSLKVEGLQLDSDLFVEAISKSNRYGAWDYSNDCLPPAWSDEIKFFNWINENKLPRELAELLYYHTPERDFMAGSHYIHGVESLIEANDDERCSNVREAGFLIVGSGPNGDDVVVDMEGAKKGAIGYFPISTKWDKTPDELKRMFIPVVDSIGDYFDIYQRGKDAKNIGKYDHIAGDYWSAKEHVEG
ncbi:hypothetical protein [Roseibacillus persicicus]|uniref:Uncharacterized protein n=1 Tax=Roseibacillus persicicus TaxID=454148 RepID=A0A918TYY8_9BACT|nr:hypothetical protein [Roseibacillus persicicus]GHC67976.1 hypothetical protein GCM10007100_40100 [Roseibacillus persicicus]